MKTSLLLSGPGKTSRWCLLPLKSFERIKNFPISNFSYSKMEISSADKMASATPVPRVGMRMEMRPELKVTW